MLVVTTAPVAGSSPERRSPGSWKAALCTHSRPNARATAPARKPSWRDQITRPVAGCSAASTPLELTMRREPTSARITGSWNGVDTAQQRPARPRIQP